MRACIKTTASNTEGRVGTAPSDGTYFLTTSGTAEKPIVIKARRRRRGDLRWRRRLQPVQCDGGELQLFRRTDHPQYRPRILAGYKNIAGSSGMTIKSCQIENVGRAIYSDWSGSKDYYIADNTITGRFRADMLMGFTGRTWQNAGIRARNWCPNMRSRFTGQGHAVAYNSVSQLP